MVKKYKAVRSEVPATITNKMDQIPLMAGQASRTTFFNKNLKTWKI